MSSSSLSSSTKKHSPNHDPLYRVLCPPLNLHPPSTNPDLYTSNLAYFSSIPWCAAHLNTPGVIPFIPQCIQPIDDLRDQFVGNTLTRGDRGLQHLLCFFQPDDEAHLRDPSRPILRVSSFFSLGDGVCGYEAVVHGGMTMTMVDESMGVVNEINTALKKSGTVFTDSSVTAALDIKFLKQIPTNSVVCVTTWIEGIEGRKTKLRGEITDKDGVKLATCSSTWVALKPKI